MLISVLLSFAVFILGVSLSIAFVRHVKHNDIEYMAVVIFCGGWFAGIIFGWLDRLAPMFLI